MTPEHDGGASIDGTKILIPHYKLLSIIGRGANGIVFKARHEFLNREHAVKVWLKLKPGDDRNKFSQGIDEARKAASLNSSYVVPIYHAGDAGGVFYCAMEYLKGPTLKELLSGTLYCDFAQRHALATLFLDAVFKTSRDGTFHGDLHQKNIIVLKNSIRLLDFGTSRFTSKGSLERRHWKIVHETFKAILKPFDIDELYRGIPLYGSENFAYSDDPKLSILPPSKYEFFLAQVPFFVISTWASELGLELDEPQVEDTRRLITSIHPIVLARLRRIKHILPAEQLAPLIRRLEVPENYDMGGTYRLNWRVTEREIVPITLQYTK